MSVLRTSRGIAGLLAFVLYLVFIYMLGWGWRVGIGWVLLFILLVDLVQHASGARVFTTLTSILVWVFTGRTSDEDDGENISS